MSEPNKIYEYIVTNTALYNRQFTKEDIQTIYDEYIAQTTDFNEPLLISQIENYHMMKNNLTRTQQEKDNVKNWRQARRASVCSESFFPNDFFCDCYQKSPETFQFLSDTLVNDVPFGFLTPKQKHKLIDTMKSREVSKDFVLIKEGENDNKMYIVEEGSFNVFKNKCLLKTLKRGDYFGEIALLHNVERTATVISRENSKIWEVEQKVFLGLRASDRNKNKEIILEGISELKLYPDLNEKELISFVNTLSFDYCKENDVVCVKEDEVFMFTSDGVINDNEVVKKKMVVYKDFICRSVIEGSCMKRRQRKLYN